MCTTMSVTASNIYHSLSKRQRGGKDDHQCLFRIMKCSGHQLCILCFLLCYFAMGNVAAAQNISTAPLLTNTTTTSSPLKNVHCVGDSCYLKIQSNEEALKKMALVSEHLFHSYSTVNDSKRYVDAEGLEKFLNDVRPAKDEHAGHDHMGHDHEGHGHGGHDHSGHDHDHDGHDHEDHDHEGHDHDHVDLDPADWTEEMADYFPDFMRPDYKGAKPKPEAEIRCITSVKDLVKAYFHPKTSETIHLSLGDFVTLMPQILLNMQKPECKMNSETTHNHEHDHGSKKITIENNPRNVWLISFGSVLLISLVSLLGVMLIPLVRHTKLLNQIISFLVALAVGTLTGDALLHLLPHATGVHDHSAHGHEGHDHGSEGEDDHFASMWKGLVACMGIYVFFLLETVMGFIRNRKSNKKPNLHKHNHDNYVCEEDSPRSTSPSQQKKKDPSVTFSPSDSPLLNPDDSSAPNKNLGDGDKGHVIVIDEEVLDTGNKHHHPHEVPKTIASLAWMVIMGDGLHNITDGLAIGAAFTSSIGIGLGTSLAIFCHEIPQELGDFAILLNSGMSIKQALLSNFLSACLCFVGLAIGLLVGEHSSGIILWILAFTAGGFLYIALVDMLPAMIKQLDHSDYKKRFFVQNIGILLGIGVMVIIALKEESFTHYF